MSMLMKVHAIAMALGLTLAGCSGFGGPDPQSFAYRGPMQVQAPQAFSAADLEAQIFAEVNRVRAAHGVGTLAFNGQLLHAARAHSQDMGVRNYFAHVTPEGRTPRQRYDAVGFQCRVPLNETQLLAAGENLFHSHRVATFRVSPDGRKTPYSYRPLPALVSQAVVGWLESPDHRRELLRPQWRTQAIGVFIAPDGRVYVTQNFC